MKGEKKVKAIKLTPGVHVVDRDYIVCGGVTRFSLEFWDVIKSRLNPIVKARMMFNKEDWYRLILTTADNIEIEFTGFSAGYHGEGSRGTERVLKECGFDEVEIKEVVFKNETFIMKRSVEYETLIV